MAISLRTFKRRFRPVSLYSDGFLSWEDREIKQFSWNSLEVKNAHPRCVWTVIDADGRQYIVPGFHRVNRLYCILTSEPWKDDSIEVRLE